MKEQVVLSQTPTPKGGEEITKRIHIYTRIKNQEQLPPASLIFLMTKLDVLQAASFLLATKLELARLSGALRLMTAASIVGKRAFV